MRSLQQYLLALAVACVGLSAYAQPANDNCATAQNLGSLPTPQSCTSGPGPTRGVGATAVFNSTNLAATPSSPYISMTGCQQGNASTTSPSSDVWYQVTLTGTELVVDITGGINQPNFALWQGTCGSLTGLGCATGNAGSLSTTFQGLIPGTYYIQVSGGNINDRGNFTMTLHNDLNCAACFTSHTLTVNPLPTNGYYQAGTAVTFCFSVTGWVQQSTNWLHGVELDFGGGWNLGSLVPTPPASSCDGSAGTWGWFNSVTSTATGSVNGPGFFFDRNNDGNPGNNFGDNCITTSPGIGDWVFCWTITTRSDCGAPGFDPDLSIIINTLADGEAGSWGSIACQNDPDIFYSAQVTCCPQPLIVNTNVLCNGQCTATATATGQGTGPWNYTWINTAGNVTIRTQNNVAGPDNITGLCAGTYIVRTFDTFEGCTAQDTFVVTQPAAITGTPAVVNVLCNGGSTGSITINGTAGGNGVYLYSLNGGPFQASNVFSGLPAGTYTVTIRDGNNCTTTLTNIVVNQPAAITGTPVVVNVLCNGGSTGSITINPTSGGNGVYQYSLNGGPFQASNAFTGLPAGTYTVTIRDGNNCTATLTNIVVTQPAAITGTPAVVNVLCNGASTGSITINGTAGGNGVYQYSLNGGPFQASNVFSGLPAGTYTVTIRDGNNCTTTLTNIVITQPAAITGTPAVVNVLCNGASTGSITINGTAGGNGVYQYSLNGGPFQASNVFSGLPAGTYTVTIRDGNNCTTTLTNIVVTQPAAITGTPVVVNVTCNGGSTGSITINPTSGGNGVYQYSLNGGPFQASNAFTGLPAGTYTVTIRDGNNCTATLTNIVVAEPAAITGTPAVVNVLCNGASTGSITINGTAGGNGVYQYSLDGGPFQASNVFSGLPAGTYTVTIRDGNNCTATLTNIVITQPAAITGTPSTTTAACGTSTGSITINGTAGGAGGYQYSLNGGPFQASNTFPNLAAGTYTVTIRDANNCTVTLTNIVVNSTAAITGTPAVVNVTCNGGSDGSITINGVSGGTGPYNYSLNGGPTQLGNVFSGLPAGTYTVTVTDQASCTLTLTNIVVSQPAAITGTPAVVNVTCNGGSTGSITINGTSGGNGSYQYSLNGGPFQAGNAFTGLAAGTYTVTIRDGNNCTATLTNIVVAEPAVITGTPAVVNVLCNGGSTGSITINGTAGGNGVYQYSLDGGPFQASNVFSGLPAGTYTVTIRDGNNCTATLTNIMVSEPTALAGTAAIVDASCGAANGSITVNGASGGAGGYQYSLNGGPLQGSNVFAGLAAGTYSVTIQDANGCQLVLSNLVVNTTAAITGTPVAVDVTCNGGNDGSITINGVSGGTGPYNYSLNGGPTQLSNVFSGLPAGTYTVTVTDQGSCTLTLTNIVVGQPAAVTANAAVVDVLCNGGSTGSITVNNATGGNGSYQYSLDGGPFQAGNAFTGLPAGTYTVTIRDGNNCTGTIANIVVNEPTALSGTPQVTPVACNGAANGAITLGSPAGGAGGYQYSLDGGPLQGSNTFSPLAPGTYTLTMTDANGCSLTFNNLVVTEPTALAATDSTVMGTCVPGNDGEIWIINATGGAPGYQYSLDGGPFQASNGFTGVAGGAHVVNMVDQNGCTLAINVVVPVPGGVSAMDSTLDVSCNGANDGEIHLLASGGAGGYTFSINGGPFQGSNAFLGLGGGSYQLTVLDQLGCSYQLTALVEEPAPITAADSTVGATCNPGGDGEIWVLNASGGTGTILYSLNGGPNQTANNFLGLNGGSYVITLYDQNGCSLVVNSTVATPGNVTATSAGTDPTCPGGSDGTIAVNGQSSAPPLQYSLNGGPFQGSGSFGGLAAGTYTVDVRDALGCIYAVTVTLTAPNALAWVDSTVAVTCFGGNDGQILVGNVTGGTPGYQYSINGGPLQGSPNFAGLAAGTYQVQVVDANGCSVTYGTSVGSPTALVLGSSSTQSTCGNADGTATVSASGGTPGYTYLWSDGQSTATAVGLVAGGYTVTVTDANGCQQQESVSVTNIGAPTLATSVNSNVSCLGANDGSATVAVSGGTGPFTYAWSTAVPQTGPTLSGVGGGTWTVTVTDALGCVTLDSVTISEPTALAVSAAGTDPSCFGLADGSGTVSALGGTTGYSYLWSNGSTQQSPGGLPAGAYGVTVTDANGCTATAGISLADPLQVIAAFSSNPAMPTQLQLPNAVASFNNESINATGYAWAFGDGNGSSEEHPTHTYTTVGEYCVTLVAMDTTGCADTVMQCNYTVFQRELDIPNTFTPNGDGSNDFFEIVGLEMFPNNHLAIFNRWGNLVYERDQYNNNWQGENYKNGQPLPDGSYFYIFSTGIEGQEDIMGDVVIFR